MLRNAPKRYFVFTLFAGGALVLLTGCLPDNFWVDLWGTIVASGVTTVSDGIIEGATQ